MSTDRHAWAFLHLLVGAVLGPTKEDLPPEQPKEGNPQAFLMDYFARKGKRERLESEEEDAAEELAGRKAWQASKLAEARALKRQRAEAAREASHSHSNTPRPRY